VTCEASAARREIGRETPPSVVFCKMSVVLLNKTYHILTRASERFTFAAGKKLHIAKQCFTTDAIRLFTSSNNLSYPYSRKRALHFAAGKSFTLRSNASRRMQSVSSHPQIIYHILTHASERFTFAAGKKLHIAKQCFMQDLSCASYWFAVQTNTHLFREKRGICCSACPAIARRATIDHLRDVRTD